MRCLPVCSLALLLLLVSAASAAAEQPCTNGSFETLDAGGFPVDWGPVGDGVEVVADAHHGTRALRLRRTPDTQTPETGLNRGWHPTRGTAQINQLAGGVEFYYKAESADATKLMVFVIPMNAQSTELTSVRRAEFTVPDDHVGDGQWHQGRLKYDFTRAADVQWVHFAARILGASGELLLDDFSYVERTGPILQFGTGILEEDPAAPGDRCTVRVPLWNRGDEPARDIQLTLQLPAGCAAHPDRIALPELAADRREILRLAVVGQRHDPGAITLRAQTGTAASATRLECAPQLEVVSFGPTAPLGTVAAPVTVQCVLRNAGTAWLPATDLLFTLPSGTVQKTAPRLAPGCVQTVTAAYVPTEQSIEQEAGVNVRCSGATDCYAAQATVVVGAATELPAPRHTLHSQVADDWAILENDQVRYVVRRHQFGWGPGELHVHTADAWTEVAQIPQLSRLVSLDAHDNRHEYAVIAPEPPAAERSAGEARLMFHWSTTDADGARWDAQIGVSLTEHSKLLRVTHALQCSQAQRLLAFDSFMLHALARDEAVFPGLEWLVDDEVSSSTLDIAPEHADRIRYVVHPNMVTVPAIGIHAPWGTVGLLWDLHQKWDGQHDRPAVVFASPDRFHNYGTHVAGLFVPGVPEWVPVNQREAHTPYPMPAGQPLRLECQILADAGATDALAPLDAWLDAHGLPDPAALPHGSYPAEIEFSMQGYLQSLWIPAERMWWTSKGGGIMSDQDRPPLYVADLLIGAQLAPAESVRQACRDRAAEVLPLLGRDARIDAVRFGNRFDLALVQPGLIASLLQARDGDGMWAFDADHLGEGPFTGLDYRNLGPDQAVELGTTAIHTYQVLRYARIAGDRTAYQQMLPTLERMTRFRVPRAAQVWEVPVHTPDILAASQALDAFLEAYRFSSDPRWLEAAVRQARLGLPFIYLWDDPAQPYLVGASIPVFGATWFQGSWFGRPVQWNGLCYANSLLRLAAYDNSRDWRKLAEAIVRSALHQQDQTGENVALWPDNISAIDGEKCPWVFAPRQIIQSVLTLMDRDEEPATLIVGDGPDRLHITATARLEAAVWDAGNLTFQAAFPAGEEGCVLIANITRPSAVALAGAAVAERENVETGTDAGWRYDPASGLLTIRVPRSGDVAISISGAQFRQVERLPVAVTQIAFEFEDTTDGWIPANHISALHSAGGLLQGHITGPDPFLIRPVLDVAADTCRVIELRLRLTSGRGAQLFWTTKRSPAFDEAKAIHLPLAPDSEFHTVTVDVGAHPHWTGQITGLRIDPGGGAAAAEFAIDYVRGK